MTLTTGNGISDIDLQAVAETLAALAHRLTARSANDADPSTVCPCTKVSARPDLVARAETLYRVRRRRGRYFDEQLFGEPAWDLLLDLFIQGEKGSRVSVSSACMGAAVPPTTALRWIDSLVRMNLLRRVADTGDGRRIFLELSEEARAKITRFLEAEL